MAINQNIIQSRFGARQRHEFTLPPMPKIPGTMLRRFPELEDYQMQMDRWREQSVALIADAILAFSQDVNKAP